jgi:hypothetical protein
MMMRDRLTVTGDQIAVALASKGYDVTASAVEVIRNWIERGCVGGPLAGKTLDEKIDAALAIRPQECARLEFMGLSTIQRMYPDTSNDASFVTFKGVALMTVDSAGYEGLRDAHKVLVSRALWSHTAHNPLAREPLPPRAVLEEYVELREKFPEQFALAELASDLRHTRGLFEDRLAQSQATLRAGFAHVREIEEGTVADGIKLHTRISNLVWALEMLPDASVRPVRRGEPISASAPTLAVLGEQIAEARRLFSHKIEELTAAIEADDLSLALYPRTGEEARVEFQTSVDILKWVLATTPDRPDLLAPAVATKPAGRVSDPQQQPARAPVRDANPESSSPEL